MFRDQVREVLNQTNPKQFLKRRAFLVELDQDFWCFISKKTNRCCGIGEESTESQTDL